VRGGAPARFIEHPSTKINTDDALTTVTANHCHRRAGAATQIESGVEGAERVELFADRVE
jgi:hypothetical protein